MSKPQSVVVTVRKQAKQNHVSKPNHVKEKSMSKKTTEKCSEVVRSSAVEGKAEVAVKTWMTEQFSLKLKKLAVTASLGFVAGFATHAASLP